MRRLAIGLACIGTATSLSANQPPGPAVILPAIGILPLMMLLTAIGGGYAVMGQKLRKTGIWLGILAAGVILYGLTNEWLELIVVFFFSIIAIGRAVTMLYWGVRAARSSAPPQLQSVRPRRMIAAGVLLLLTTAFLATLSAAFVGFYVWSDEFRLENLRQYLAVRQALAGPSSPQRSALESNAADIENRLLDGMRARPVRGKTVSLEEQGGARFTVYLLPNVPRWPFPPFNTMASAPSYRADQSGEIRMTRVHGPDVLCPADAPVVDRAGPKDLEDVLRWASIHAPK